MKTIQNTFSAIAAILVLPVLAATTDISGVKLEADANGEVTVTYDLGTEPRIVTMGIETNVSGDVWAAIPPERTTTVWGDVNKTITKVNSRCSFTWAAQVDLPNTVIASGKARAVLSAWTTNAPPTYMVLDLTAPGGVWYYENTNAFPHGGLANDLYRTKRMVFRKIPAQGVTYTMGGSTDVDSAYSGKECDTPHKVTLTRDFYIGVYELTRAQYSYLLGSKSSYAAKWPAVDFTSTFACSYCYIAQYRGGYNESVNWPLTKYEVKAKSIVGVLRYLTGLTVDYPMESEWEYACRAGSPYALCGTEPGGDTNRRNEVAWWGNSYNSDNAQVIDGETVYMPHPVGLKKPNAWGLYDMLGNVSEMCLDAVPSTGVTKLDDAVDPIGYDEVVAGTQYKRILRGGSYATWTYNSGELTAAYRGITHENMGLDYYGVRLVVPLALHDFTASQDAE